MQRDYRQKRDFQHVVGPRDCGNVAKPHHTARHEHGGQDRIEPPMRNVAQRLDGARLIRRRRRHPTGQAQGKAPEHEGEDQHTARDMGKDKLSRGKTVRRLPE